MRSTHAGSNAALDSRRWQRVERRDEQPLPLFDVARDHEQDPPRTVPEQRGDRLGGDAAR